MASGYQIDIQVVGREALERTFERFPEIYDQRMGDAMRRAVITVESEVKPLTPVGVSSRLRNSIASEVSGFGMALTGKVGSTLKDEVYPAVMEFGRKPGRMPPVDALVRWVHLQLGVPNDEARGVAFLVARAIGKRGIKGKFFFRTGWEKSKDRVMKYFDQALGSMVDDMRKVK